MKVTLLEQHKLLFKRWSLSNKNQLECQGRSALQDGVNLLSVSELQKYTLI